MSTRSAEYREMIEDILARDADLRAQGLPGIDEDHWVQLKDLVANAIENVKSKMDEK
jgi:hypothetical protein